MLDLSFCQGKFLRLFSSWMSTTSYTFRKYLFTSIILKVGKKNIDFLLTGTDSSQTVMSGFFSLSIIHWKSTRIEIHSICRPCAVSDSGRVLTFID